MPHEYKAILDAPPELLAKAAPLMAAMVILIIAGISWLAFRHRKLRRTRRPDARVKPRKKR
jgi:hypothetical protein